MRLIPVCLAAIALTASVTPGRAATINVPDDQPTIQAGIDAASAGDTVLVACGTYYEHDIILRSGVHLRSAGGQADCATIDAEGAGRVLKAVDLDAEVTIDGFTITGGLADDDGYTGGGLRGGYCSLVISNCVFESNHAVWYGGGLIVRESDLRITGCEFRDNRAEDIIEPWSEFEAGGAMACFAGSDVQVVDCVFTGNTADDGGAVRFSGDAFDVSGSTFSDNSAWLFGGAIYGSGMHIEACEFVGNTGMSGGGIHGSGTIQDCRFEGNIGTWQGGGMALGSESVVEDCLLIENTALGVGGGASVFSGHLTFNRVTWLGNSAGDVGGALYVEVCGDATVTIANSSLVANSAEEGASAVHLGGLHRRLGLIVIDSIVCFAPAGPAVVCEDEAFVSLTCCDIFGNDDGDWTGCIADQLGAAGNFSADPLLCNIYEDDLTLCSNSPCLPENNSCGSLIGAHGKGCGPCDSAVEETTWGAIKALYRR